MDLISIIVPIYNVEKYIVKCIDSIINQTYQNLEIILVDDGSPDNCGKICDEYAQKDNRIKVIHKENGGVSSARNVGLNAATGSYISFIDSDDIVTHTFIEQLYTLCKTNQVDIAECDFERFSDNQEIKTKEKVEKIDILNSDEMQIRLYNEYHVRTVVLWNKIYKAYIFDDITFPNGKINEDEAMIHLILNACKTDILLSNQVLYYYRYNEESIMKRKFNVSRLDGMDALKNRKDYYQRHGKTELYNLTVKKYQSYLRDYYIMTKRYISSPEKYLKNIIAESKENLKEYCNMNDIGKFAKIKFTMFTYFPNLYYILYRCFSKK